MCSTFFVSAVAVKNNTLVVTIAHTLSEREIPRRVHKPHVSRYPRTLERVCFTCFIICWDPQDPTNEKDRTTETIKSKTKHFSLAAAEGTLSISLIYSFATIMQNPSLHSSRCCCLSSSTDITIILSSSSSSSSSFKLPAASRTMISSRVSIENQFITIIPKVPRFQKSSLKPVLCSSLNNRIHNNDNDSSSSRGSNSFSKFLNSSTKAKTAHVLVTTTESSSVSLRESERLGSWGGGGGDEERRRDVGEVGINNFNKQMLVLCGLGYWVQGFRCFPWLALNFHMAHNLSLHPSTLQLVQNSGNLPMVAKPLYGILSDALYIGGAHRIPYICIGG